VDFNRVGLNTTAFANEIRLAGAAHGVEEALVRAVIHAESAFNFNALSNKGAQGLMQLMPATAARLVSLTLSLPSRIFPAELPIWRGY
jgi:soluble lytic murein transglycosylase-like protein